MRKRTFLAICLFAILSLCSKAFLESAKRLRNLLLWRLILALMYFLPVDALGLQEVSSVLGLVPAITDSDCFTSASKRSNVDGRGVVHQKDSMLVSRVCSPVEREGDEERLTLLPAVARI
ncbi:hypothetical protein B0H34DRAFT_732884 [Crassisporium funariophilum]|nr:hypothetical protein B0H34DRAFT_732884 [Crassisporium funariophilum]